MFVCFEDVHVIYVLDGFSQSVLWIVLINFNLQHHPHTGNIYKQLEGPCAILRGMDDYSEEEIKLFPNLVNANHL